MSSSHLDKPGCSHQWHRVLTQGGEYLLLFVECGHLAIRIHHTATILGLRKAYKSTISDSRPICIYIIIIMRLLTCQFSSKWESSRHGGSMENGKKSHWTCSFTHNTYIHIYKFYLRTFPVHWCTPISWGTWILTLENYIITPHTPPQKKKRGGEGVRRGMKDKGKKVQCRLGQN